MDRKYQDAKKEEKTLPNTLLEMQDISNSPWDNGGITRDDYINMVKNQEMIDERNEKEPKAIKLP